jgi:hypothetical protein
MRVSALVGLQKMLKDIFRSKKFFEYLLRVSGKLVLANQILILKYSFFQFLFPEFIINLLLFGCIVAVIRS